MDETLRNELREDTKRLEVLSAWADARHAESKKEMKACLEEVIEIANRLNDAWWRESSIRDANKALALLEKGKNPFNLSCARGCRHCKTVSRESAQGWCAFRASALSLNDGGNGCLDWDDGSVPNVHGEMT